MYFRPLYTLYSVIKVACAWFSISKWTSIDPSHKSHNAPDRYPTMHHFVTELCTHVYTSVLKCALWDEGLVYCGIRSTGLWKYVFCLLTQKLGCAQYAGGWQYCLGRMSNSGFVFEMKVYQTINYSKYIAPWYFSKLHFYTWWRNQ